MSNEERVVGLLKSISPNPLCDDCITKRLNFSVRQTANIITRQLAESVLFTRHKDSCYTCGGFKKVILTRARSNHALAHPSPKNQSQVVPNDIVVNAGEQFAQKPAEGFHSEGLKDLIEIGFAKIGYWMNDDTGITMKQEALKNASPALYAFVCNGNIFYVGKTSQRLSKRLYFYGKPGASQRTNMRINALISEQLKLAEKIEVWAFSPTHSLRVGRFSINLPAGLEDDIIQQFRPIWNVR